MKVTSAYLERPYCGGTLGCLLLAEDEPNGQKSYGVSIIANINGKSISAQAPGITSDPNTALMLLFYFFIEGVDPCQLDELLDELLPIEESLPLLIESFARTDPKLRAETAEQLNAEKTTVNQGSGTL